MFIYTNTTINIPSDYPTILDAMDYLMDFTILSGVEITINVASGVYIHDRALPNHSENKRIKIVGSSASFPSQSDFVITGNDNAARAIDNANHLTMLQSKYGVHIECDNTSFIASTKGDGAPEIQNLLIYSIGGGVVGYRLYDGLGYFSKVSFHGFGSTNIAVVNSGNFRGTKISSSGSNQYGFQSSDVSDIKITSGAIAASNRSGGFFGKRNGCAEYAFAVSIGNGGHGFYQTDSGMMDAPNSYSAYNGGNGYGTALGGDLIMVSAISEFNNSYGILNYKNGNIIAENSEVKDNGKGGIAIVGNGDASLKNAEVTNNNGHGLRASGACSIDADNIKINDNNGHGILATDLSRTVARNADLSGNTKSNTAIIDNGTYIQLT